MVATVANTQAATVFTDTFNYTADAAFVAEGGWTSTISVGALGSGAGSGIMFGNPASGESALEYNYTVNLNEGDVITMNANVDRGNNYFYGMRIFLWDGAGAGTRVEKAGGNQQGVGGTSGANHDLTQVSYTVSNTDISAGLNQVIFKYSNEGNWSQTNDVTFDVTPVPEPSSTALLGLGGLALILRRRK